MGRGSEGRTLPGSIAAPSRASPSRTLLARPPTNAGHIEEPVAPSSGRTGTADALTEVIRCAVWIVRFPRSGGRVVPTGGHPYLLKQLDTIPAQAELPDEPAHS